MTFTGSANNYQVRMPTRNNAPPGDYMLFAMNAAGTPSIAKIIRLGSEAVTQELANGEYWFASPSSDQRLTAPSWNGFKSRMLNASVYNDQKWRVNYIGGRVYTIQNVGTGRYMEVENSACANLTQISGATSSASNNQRWVISKTGSNYQFRPVNCITKGLDREQDLNDANGILFNFIPNHAPQLWSVTPVNAGGNAPVGNPDTVTVAQNTSITIDPLANDTGTGLILNAPNPWSQQGGTVALVSNKLVYKSKATFTGTDRIWYTFKDSQNRVTNSVITITVTGGTTNPYPTATPDNVTTTTGTSITVDALANDTGNGLTLNPLNPWSWKGGTVSVSGNKVVYKSKAGFTGLDKVWYSFVDSQGRSNSGVINITVNSGGAGAFPVANSDTYYTARNTALTLSVLANDTSSSGKFIDNLFAYTSQGGTTTQTADGRVLYTPKNNFSGQDDFWYVMRDSEGRKNSAQVKINVAQ